MFPGPTLTAATTAIVEAALNRALALDPAGREALRQALTGPVQVSLTAPLSLTYALEWVADSVQVRSQPSGPPALTLRGRPVALAALALGDDRVFQDGRLEVEGDMALAHQLQRALRRLNPDWEAAMARQFGDVPAHFIGRRIRNAVRWSRQATQAMTANIEEYVHEERRALPGRRELEASFADIDDLHLRAERLEARLRHLEDHGSTDTPETP
jgi:ubiquinone biosynthesis protein UbiJ